MSSISDDRSCTFGVREEILNNKCSNEIIPIHNNYFNYCEKYSKFCCQNPDREIDYNYFIYLIELEDCFFERYIYKKSKYYYSLAKNNFIIPSLYYKCFSIKNLGLTSSEHMHILAPLQHKIYYLFIRIKSLFDNRYLDVKKEQNY